MSTVNKGIADRIIAGEFPEDNIVAIIRYENIFDGNYAYKIISENHKDDIPYYLAGKSPAMLDCTIYWQKEGI